MSSVCILLKMGWDKKKKKFAAWKFEFCFSFGSFAADPRTGHNISLKEQVNSIDIYCLQMINWSLWRVRLVRKAFIVSAAFNCNGKCCCGAIKNYTIASIFYIHDKCSLLISALCHNGSLIISVLKSWLRIRIWQNIDSDIFTIFGDCKNDTKNLADFINQWPW